MILPSQLPTVRASLMATASQSPLLLTGILAGLSLTAAHAADWNGASNNDWNTPGNWNPAGVPSNAHAIINTNTPNRAIINANMSATPVDINVGSVSGANTRLDHLTGTGQTGVGNWMFVGRGGGTGVYNLANTATPGTGLTAYSTGTGSMNVRGRMIIGGENSAGSIGTANVNTSGSLVVRDNLLIGSGTATSTDTGTLNLDAGLMTTGSWTEIGRGGPNCKGYINIAGGTFRHEGINGVIIGAEGGKGYGKFTGGSFVSTVTGSNGQFRIGNNSGSAGELEVSGSTTLVDIAHEIFVGNNTGATGKLTFSGGEIKTISWVAIGRKDPTNLGAGGTGTVTMTGGTWTKTGDSNFIVGASGAGSMTMSGGIVDVGTSSVADRGITWIAEQNNCTGSLTLSGTADFRTARMTVAVNSGTTGTLNLDGGIARVGQITGGAGSDTVHFNGTELIARANQTSFVTGFTTSDVKGGGLKVNTNGFNVTIPQVLTAATPSGGVTKTGAGTLTLTGANSYTGNHTISAGKLAVTNDHAGGGSFTIADGAKMGVIQTNDLDALDAANVTFEGANGSSLEIDLGNNSGNPAVAPLNVLGTLTLN